MICDFLIGCLRCCWTCPLRGLVTSSSCYFMNRVLAQRIWHRSRLNGGFVRFGLLPCRQLSIYPLAVRSPSSTLIRPWYSCKELHPHPDWSRPGWSNAPKPADHGAACPSPSTWAPAWKPPCSSVSRFWMDSLGNFQILWWSLCCSCGPRYRQLCPIHRSLLLLGLPQTFLRYRAHMNLFRRARWSWQSHPSRHCFRLWRSWPLISLLSHLSEELPEAHLTAPKSVICPALAWVISAVLRPVIFLNIEMAIMKYKTIETYHYLIDQQAQYYSAALLSNPRHGHSINWIPLLASSKQCQY